MLGVAGSNLGHRKVRDAEAWRDQAWLEEPATVRTLTKPPSFVDHERSGLNFPDILAEKVRFSRVNMRFSAEYRR